MSDVVAKVRMHTDIVKALSDLRRRYIPADVEKAQALHQAEVAAIKSRNDSEFVVAIALWLSILSQKVGA